MTPAAVRLPRTVAARRALLAGLFLVGFVALGFAFGSGAHADDRDSAQALSGAAAPGRTTADAPSSARSHLTAPARAEAAPPAGAPTPVRAATRDGAVDDEAAADGAVADGADEGAERVDRQRADVDRQGADARAEMAERKDAASATVTEAVRPAAERTAPVTDPIADPVTGVVREVRGAAGAALPGGLPAGENAGRPGNGDAPEHGCGPQGTRPDGSGTGRTADGRATGPAVDLSSPDAADLGNFAAERAGSAVPEQRDQRHDGGLPGQFPQGPAAPTSHTAGDGHGPRGGDQHSTAPADPTRFRLLPGGVRTADGAPTRRRAEDILEFPG
ncbi:hypothetical protein [Streptomyces sp. NPDC093589]|uniref:hypothetical protein n=1 Tax=Streptomyces sp. NPDC093589 TaxID=3366043 RepID=UPI0038222B30